MNAARETHERVQGTAERHLIFSLRGEWYAIPLLKLREVIPAGPITPVPFTPPYFKGIINLRGQVISVIDLRARFRLAEEQPTPETAIIILDLPPLRLGAIVDSVDMVLNIENNEISGLPSSETGVSTDHISGVTRHEGKLILLLDIARAVNLDELRALVSKRSVPAQKAK